MDKETLNDKLYPISEVGAITGVPPHALRQWEERFPQLRPRRLRTGRRAYTARDIEIIRRIKTLLKHEGMTTQGARTRLAQELGEAGRPKNRQEMLAIVDKIADEARAIRSLADPADQQPGP